MNVIYFAMLERLTQDNENPERPRTLLDQQLQVREWRSPGSRRITVRRSDVPSNAPSWWVDDEEASQSFMQSMRIVVLDEG